MKQPNNQFILSEKEIRDSYENPAYKRRDVKEFIRLLKDKVESNAFLTASGNPRYNDWLLEQIDKLTGEKLI